MLQSLSCTTGVIGFSVPSQATIYGHYDGLFPAIVMDSAQLLSIMEKDGRTAMPEITDSCSSILH